MGTNCDLFRRTVLQKCQKVNNCSLYYVLGSGIFEEFQHPEIQTKIVQPFGGFFQQIKVRQPTGRGSDSLLYEAAKNFEVFSNSQN
jgi:hypothetical protein